MQEDNIIVPKSVITGEVLSDMDDEVVSSFLECFRIAEESPQRVKKMQELDEDERIYDNLFANLPKKTEDQNYYDQEFTEIPPMMKASLYMHLFSKYEIDGNKIPKFIPYKQGYPDADKSIIESIRGEVFEVGGFEDLYTDDIFEKFKYEGCPVIQIGYAEDEISYDNPDLREMYFDPTGRKLQSNSNYSKLCKWSIRKKTMERRDFDELLRTMGKEDMIEKIPSGSPINVSIPQNEENEEYGIFYSTLSFTDPIDVFYCDSVGNSKDAIHCVFAGKTAVKVNEARGEKYPHWKNIRGKMRPILPYDMFHFLDSKYRNSLYSSSMIGVIKDGAEALKKMLNKLLPHMATAVNGYLALFGDDESRTVEDMKVYKEIQNMGYTPLIQSSNPNTSMQFVAPDATQLWDAYEKARKVILDDIGTKIRVNFRIQEEVDQSATEFVGKVTDQNKQVSSLNANNRTVFQWVAETSVDYAKKHWSKSDDRKIFFSVTGNDGKINEFSVALREILVIMEDWDGTFYADTDMSMPMSEAEKRNVVTTLINNMIMILQGVEYVTIEEVSPLLKLVYKNIAMGKMDNEITYNDILKMAESVIARRQPQPTSEQQSSPQTNEQGMPMEPTMEEEVQKKDQMSNQKFKKLSLQ